jgi:alkylation response protein AidB-like acyl-CoA dehydrogenase
MVLGAVGDGWRQVTSELAFERGGPERFLSTYPLLEHLARECVHSDGDAELVGALVARLWALRRLGFTVASRLARGEDAAPSAALIKDLGTRFEGDVIESAMRVLGAELDPESPDRGVRLLSQAVLQSPGFTIRGGTSEILRGMVARSLGVHQ